MQIIRYDIFKSKSDDRCKIDMPIGLCLGYFDGVHRGHRELFSILKDVCRDKNFKSVVFTFSDLDNRESRLKTIQTLAQRLEKIASCGIDYTFIQDFNLQFMTLKGIDFLDILNESYNLKLIVVGFDFTYGSDHCGIEDLRRWAKIHNIEVIISDPVKMYGDEVHSTRIRKCISDGRLEEATSLLVTPYSIKNTVVHGKKLGRTIGFPTINQEIPLRLITPPDGVYVSRICIGNHWYDSVSAIGVRPTVETSGTKNIETFVFDYHQECYGQEVVTELIKFIRPELKFNALSEMVSQMHKDCDFAVDFLKHNPVMRLSCISGNTPVYTLYTDGFHTASVVISYSLPVDKDSSARALGMEYQMALNSKFHDRGALTMAMKKSWGMRIDAYVSQNGGYQDFNFVVNALLHAPDHSSPLIDGVDMLIDSLLTPYLDNNGNYEQDTFLNERQNLAADVSSRLNDKDEYAVSKLMKHIYGDDPRSFDGYGEAESISKIDAEKAYASFQKLLNKTPEMVIYSGCKDAEIYKIILSKIEKLTNLNSGCSSCRTIPQKIDTTNSIDSVILSDSIECLPFSDPAKPLPRKPLPDIYEVEIRDVEQSRLLIYFDMPFPPGSMKSAAANFLVNCFGGDSDSLLFRNVREKHSLAYSITSYYINADKAMLVFAGVIPGSETKAIALIRSSLEEIIQGMDESDFKNFKAGIIDELGGLYSNRNALSTFYTKGVKSGLMMKPEDLASFISELTIQDMSEIARMIKIKCIYILKGNGGQEEYEA